MGIRRENRKEKLNRQGFLPEEVKEFSTIGKYPPYFQQMVRVRTARLANSQRQNQTRAEFEQMIRDEYRRNNWMKGKNISPWELLRKFEDHYKMSHTDYESPSGKKKSPVRHINFNALNTRPKGF